MIIDVALERGPSASGPPSPWRRAEHEERWLARLACDQGGDLVFQ
jgi:hypothetical protein